MKVDTTGIEFLEGDFGMGRTVSPGASPKVAKKPVKPAVRVAKVRFNPLQGVSNYQLVRELSVRHYKFVLTALFWGGVGALIVILGR